MGTRWRAIGDWAKWTLGAAMGLAAISLGAQTCSYLADARGKTVGAHWCRELAAAVNNGKSIDVARDEGILRTYCSEKPWKEP